MWSKEIHNIHIGNGEGNVMDKKRYNLREKRLVAYIDRCEEDGGYCNGGAERNRTV